MRRLTHEYGAFSESGIRRRHSAASDFHPIPGTHAGSALTASNVHSKTIERHQIGLTKRKRDAQREYFGRSDAHKNVCRALHGCDPRLSALHVIPVCQRHDHGCREPVDMCERHMANMPPAYDDTYVVKCAA